MAKILVRNLKRADAPVMAELFAAVPWRDKDEAKFQRYFQEQQAGARKTLVAYVGGGFAGYGNVVWALNYPPFREAGIPEIQDLNVLPAWRRRGVATAIVDEAEKRIAQRAPVAGIGVGLYADYGPAQRMYALRGYVPDGTGGTFHDKRVAGGDQIIADDDLILHLTKRLHPPAELLDRLRALETTLHQPAVRRDPQRLDALLRDDFLEIGRSGSLYTKQDILELLPAELGDPIWSQEYALELLGPGLALLTYRSAKVAEDGSLARHARRSSLWQKSPAGWQMRFHQGTPTAPLANGRSRNDAGEAAQ